jgi:hypothetical protein
MSNGSDPSRRDGTISVGAGENLLRDCATGHCTYVVEEIHALEHGKLSFIRKVREGVY